MDQKSCGRARCPVVNSTDSQPNEFDLRHNQTDQCISTPICGATVAFDFDTFGPYYGLWKENPSHCTSQRPNQSELQIGISVEPRTNNTAVRSIDFLLPRFAGYDPRWGRSVPHRANSTAPTSTKISKSAGYPSVSALGRDNPGREWDLAIGETRWDFLWKAPAPIVFPYRITRQIPNDWNCSLHRSYWLDAMCEHVCLIHWPLF